MRILLFRNKEKIYSFFIYLTIFLFSVYPASDLDAGWHYKYGEYFFKHGKILTTDIFSWTMYGFQWINHSWAYDLFFYLLQNSLGLVGLSLIGAFIILLTFYFIIANFNLSFWKKAFLGVFFVLLSESAILEGLRSQVVSALFFAILMFLLIRIRQKIKTLVFLPPLFLLWVNFHGDYILGLGITVVFLASYFIIDYFKTKKFDKKTFIFYVSSIIALVLVALINPFGYKIYLESFVFIGNPAVKGIMEWLPIYVSCQYCHVPTFSLYTCILLIVFIYYLVKRNFFVIPFILISLVMIYPTIDTRRLLPVFMILTLPLLADFLKNIKWDLEKYKSVNYLAILLIIITLEFNLYNRFTGYNLYNFTEADYCRFSSECSVRAVNYLLSHPPSGKGFNFYNWGGYLIGKGVPVKLFIDGRMDVWVGKNGYSAFTDYNDILNGTNNSEKFKKYNFDWLFIPNSSNLAQEIFKSDKLGKWKLVFADGNTGYFVKVK